jgi:bacteriorhodopsin
VLKCRQNSGFQRLSQTRTEADFSLIGISTIRDPIAGTKVSIRALSLFKTLAWALTLPLIITLTHAVTLVSIRTLASTVTLAQFHSVESLGRALPNH